MSIVLTDVSKAFGSHRAVDGVSLDIGDGEFFVVLGPSGCGKSTLLRLIAGLEPLDGGTIRIGGRDVAGPRLHLPPEARNVGVVFQSYALWPHMSVAGNVAFPLQTAGLAGAEVARRTADCLATVELGAFAERRPADLSGGQRQRVALARCLAQGARTILMDEPLANLDPHLRGAMEEEIAAFHRASGATTLFITHDQREAMALADRIAILWQGQILQADAPDVLYSRPADARVAGFIGRSTIVSAVVTGVYGPRARVDVFGQTFEMSCSVGTGTGPARVVVRPEQVRIAGEGAIETVIERATYRGGHWEALGRAQGSDQPILVNVPHKVSVGEVLPLAFEAGWVLPVGGHG
ncbi:ABC transporter ATP-binding protein [Polymorphum gilvum]|uniref:ABC transporter component n=1 Tax=Polymorphum gilvum (strain LMG 25793 / CGMCC 1.9160 / SL003B-26A1) TaxID=991905 RepID=F2IXR5_POLGS|nr:ABC transporter ATP-binding protein [Polymorphum gilvum]ADZ69396.1 ABC transporter component [Polymorphum gilvum SL003B-26A1]